MNQNNNHYTNLAFMLVFLVSILVALHFIFQIINHLEDIDKLENLNLTQLGILGDFLSGHINGFMIMLLVLSIYYQRISTEQQQESNRIILEDLQENIKANTEQSKELSRMNKYKDVKNLLEIVEGLEKQIGLENLGEVTLNSKPLKYNYQLFDEIIRTYQRINSLIFEIDDKKIALELQELVSFHINSRDKYINSKTIIKTYMFNKYLVMVTKYFQFLQSFNYLNTKDIDDINMKILFLGTDEMQRFELDIRNEFEDINVNSFYSDSYNEIQKKLWNYIFNDAYNSSIDNLSRIIQDKKYIQIDKLRDQVY